MNLIEQAERLKGAPDMFLAQEAQAPSGFAPPYLILAEIGRRQSLRQRGAAQRAPQTTVYDDLVGRAGLPTMDALGRPGASQMPPMPVAERPSMQAPPQQGLAGAVPMRYRAGGVVRMQAGGVVPTIVRGVPFYAPPAPVARNYAPLVAPRINEPELSTVLEELRRQRTPATELTAPLERRISELEQQRATIQRPTLRQALFETGLGMMASRAPNALGALGQAGLGALQNYRAMQQQARAEEQDIGRQIGSLDATIANARGRQEQELFNDAMQRIQQLHGSEVVRAQTEDTTQRANRRMEEEAADRQDAANMAQWQFGNQLALKQLPPEIPYSLTAEGRKAALDDYEKRQEIETRYNKEQARALAGIRAASAVGLDAVDKRMQQQAAIDRRARSMIMEQLNQGWIDPKASPSRAIEQARAAARKNLQNDKFYVGMHPAERQLLLDSIGSFTPNKEFRDEIGSIQSDRRADALSKQTPATTAPAADVLGYKPSTSKAVRTIELEPPAFVPPALADEIDRRRRAALGY